MWVWLTSKGGARILVNFARVNEVYPDESGAILYFGTMDGDAGETDTKVQESIEAIAAMLNAKPLNQDRTRTIKSRDAGNGRRGAHEHARSAETL